MTTKEERLKVYADALETFGPEVQLAVALEEMSELQKELCKALRGFIYPARVAEELADAGIMLEQIRYIFHDTAPGPAPGGRGHYQRHKADRRRANRTLQGTAGTSTAGSVGFRI